VDPSRRRQQLPDRWRKIKAAFSKSLPDVGEISDERHGKGERGIWQRRYWEHTIRNDRDFAAHMDYIHFNPVKHGLAKASGEWKYSSFRRCVAAGFYPAVWVGGGAEPAVTGEPR
jgi:putative transposase